MKICFHVQPMSKRSFLSRVRSALPHLHPAEKKLGELVCNFPGELAGYSASELAQLAGVSNATVSRFIRRLGYPNYEEARLHAREESQTGSRLYKAKTTDSDTASANANANAYEIADIENIRTTFSQVSFDDIQDLAKAMLDARKLWIIGFRAGNSLAGYLQWQLTQVIENVVSIPGSGHTMGEHLVSIDSSDLVIVFGIRRRVAQLDAILSSVAGTGARLAYITDEGAPVHEQAEWHLRCQTGSPGPLFSHVAVMALINALANQTIELSSEDGKVRLAEIEAFNESLEELQ